MNLIKLWINDQEVEAQAHQTVLEAADSVGIRIPRLCAHPSLKPSGSCRLCAVEIDDHRGLPAACSTPVAQGMRVRTDSAKVLDFRREMLRLILQDHPRECLGCARNGTCELQRLVELVGIDFPYGPPVGKTAATLPAGSYFERDPRLCVHCGRCVRVCHEVRGAGVLVFRESHGKQEVDTAFGRSLADAGCQFCGACVDVCPVAALREPLPAYAGEPRDAIAATCEGLTKIVMDLYRKELPRGWHTSVCPLCSAHCRLSFEMTATGHIVQVRPAPGAAAGSGQACVQGRFLLREHLQGARRLKKPLVPANGRHREAEWEDALDEVARRLSAYGPGETAVLTDGRLTNEELFLLHRFAQTVLGSTLVGCLTPPGHLTVEETIAGSPAPAALRGGLGDLSEAGVILAIGVNPPATHPIGGTLLRKASLDGSRVIVINPCSVGIGRFADMVLNPPPGTEAALLCGLLQLILREGRIDSALEASQPQYVKTLRQELAAFSPESVAAVTGIHAETLLEAACLFGGDKPVCVVYGPGLITSPACRDAVHTLIHLLTLTGSIGKAGGGMIPLYGDSNLAGASAFDMTSPLFELSPASRPTPASGASGVADKLASGQIKALVVAMESSDAMPFDLLRPHLERLELVVLLDVRAPDPPGNGGTGAQPHVVLPMASVLEKGGTFTDPDGRLIEVPRLPSSGGEARSVVWIIQQLAARMKATGFPGEDETMWVEEMRRRISERTVPGQGPHAAAPGCACCGTTVQPSAVGCGSGLPDWKPIPFVAPQEAVDADYPMRAVAKETLEPYFLGPLLAREAMGAFYPDAEIEMNPSDVFRSGLQPGDAIRVASREKTWEGRVGLNPLLPEGIVVMSGVRLGWSGRADSPPQIAAVRVEKSGETNAAE